MQRNIVAFSFAVLIAGCAASAAPAAPPIDPAVAHARNGEVAYWAASSLYRIAYRTKDHADYRAAIDAYEKYLREYPESSHAYEANELDADARYAIEDWLGSALHFQRAIGIDVHAKDTEELAYANVLATRYVAGLKDDDADRACTDQPKSREEIPASELPVLAAYDLYLNLARAEDKTRATISFLKGRTLHSCAHFSDAEPIFENLVDHFSESPEAPASAALLLDCIAEQGKWSEMRDRVQALDATPLASDPILADMLREVRAQMRKQKSS